MNGVSTAILGATTEPHYCNAMFRDTASQVASSGQFLFHLSFGGGSVEGNIKQTDQSELVSSSLLSYCV